MKKFKNYLTTLVAVLVITSVVTLSAAQAQEPEAGDIDPANPQLNSQDHCFSSGNGKAFIKICISDHGNINTFESPLGVEHIRVSNGIFAATYGEGYVLCSDDGGTVHGYDAGFSESGFGPSTVTQPNGEGKFPLVITRTSTDGKVEVRQTFNWNPAAQSIFVDMRVKNLSASVLDQVTLARYFDGDLDNDGYPGASPSGTDESNDIYDRTGYAVWGKDNAYGLMLSGPTFSNAGITLPFSFIHSFGSWNPVGNGTQAAKRCTSFQGPGGPSNPGDYVGRVYYGLYSINPNTSKTVRFQYRRI